MSKVKVTQEQANLISNFQKRFKKDVAGLTYGQFYIALCDGYEVEPTFEVGDMVSLECEGTIRVIGEIVSLKKEDGVTYACVQDPKYPVPQKVSVNALHHSTPEEIAEEKERRFWKRHGRDVREVRSQLKRTSKGIDSPKLLTPEEQEKIFNEEVPCLINMENP